MSVNESVKIQGNCRLIWNCTDSEVLAEGPAGTAKTRTILELFDYLARKYPHSQQLICRKTRTSMTHTVLKTFDSCVMKHDVKFSYTRQQYEYRNGSVIVVGGLDKADKILSSEFDNIYVNEALDITEAELETLKTRLRNGKTPNQQIFLDVNPGKETHYLNKRANTKAMTRIVTTHKDNPRYYNEDTQEFTEEGKRYIDDILGSLTGLRRLRFKEGKWGSVAGVVYDSFDRSVHVIPKSKLPKTFYDIFMAIDFGYTNPFVCQWWGVDSDGRLYMFREIYQTQRTVTVLSKLINEINDKDERTKGKRILAVCDHDAEDRATLEENGIPTTPAKKAISAGIQAVKDRLKIAGDGKTRIYLVEDCLYQIDTTLSDKSLPTSSIEEVESYAWPSDKQDINNKENPIDAYNHGMDAMRYAVAHKDGFVKKDYLLFSGSNWGR